MVGDDARTGVLNFENGTYNINLSENARLDQFVIQVRASFKNGGTGAITYSFASGDENNIFRIDSRTGLCKILCKI